MWRLVNLGAFHQSQVSATLASIHGVASQILCLPLRQTAVASAFTKRDACRHGSQPKVSRQHDNAQFRSSTGPDFQSLPSGQFFETQLFVHQHHAAGTRHGKQRADGGTNGCLFKNNEHWQLRSQKGNAGDTVKKIMKKTRQTKKGTKVETLTASQLKAAGLLQVALGAIPLFTPFMLRNSGKLAACAGCVFSPLAPRLCRSRPCA